LKTLKTNGVARLAMSALMAAALTACGGGGSSSDGSSAAASTDSPSPSFTTVTGVAAVGAPLGGGTVELKCASGASTSATADASGVWTASVKSTDYPCVARVTAVQDAHYSKLSSGAAKAGSTTITLHSVVAGPGTTNITPLTDLIVGILSAQDPATWYAGAASGILSGAITPSALSSALDKLKLALATLPGKPTLPDGFNPLTSPFSAQKGDAGDDLLESFRAALDAAGLTQAQAAGHAAAGEALTQSTYALTIFTTPNMTSAFGFRGAISTNLDNQTVLAIPDPNRGTYLSQMTLAAATNMIAFGPSSPFTAGISPLGTMFGQVCTAGPGSFSDVQHSQYVYISDDLVEVTDVNELKGITFDDYEDCQLTGALAIDSQGNGIFTENGKGPDEPDANLLAAFTAEGREEVDNGITSVTRAKAYKFTLGGLTTYVYLGVSNKKGDTSLVFNGDPTYVTMGVSRKQQLPS